VLWKGILSEKLTELWVMCKAPHVKAPHLHVPHPHVPHPHVPERLAHAGEEAERKVLLVVSPV